MFSKKVPVFRWIFAVVNVAGGTAVFEFHFQGHKLTKEVELRNSTKKVI